MLGRAESHSPSFQFEQGGMCDVQTGFVVEEAWCLHIEQYKAYTSELLVNFVSLIAVFLCHDCFFPIGEAVTDDSSQRLPNSQHKLLFLKCWFETVLLSTITVQALSQTLSIIEKDLFLKTSCNTVMKLVIIAEQMNCKKHLKTASLYFCTVREEPIPAASLTSLSLSRDWKCPWALPLLIQEDLVLDSVRWCLLKLSAGRSHNFKADHYVRPLECSSHWCRMFWAKSVLCVQHWHRRQMRRCHCGQFPLLFRPVRTRARNSANLRFIHAVEFPKNGIIIF